MVPKYIGDDTLGDVSVDRKSLYVSIESQVIKSSRESLAP